MSTLVLVRNRSKVVSNLDLGPILAALNVQVKRDYAGAWNATPPNIIGGIVPAGARVSMTLDLIDDDPSSPGELGDHSVDANGNPIGRVLCVPALSNGFGNPLIDVCSVLSHELLEMLGDPFSGAWADDGHGGLIAWELCDPDQGTTYAIGPCQVSNFMLPAFFDPARKGARTNHVGTGLAPCKVAPNGYAIVEIGGTPTAIFGAHVSREQKLKALRGRLGVRLVKRGGPEALARHLAAVAGARLAGASSPPHVEVEKGEPMPASRSSTVPGAGVEQATHDLTPIAPMTCSSTLPPATLPTDAAIYAGNGQPPSENRTKLLGLLFDMAALKPFVETGELRFKNAYDAVRARALELAPAYTWDLRDSASES